DFGVSGLEEDVVECERLVNDPHQGSPAGELNAAVYSANLAPATVGEAATRHADAAARRRCPPHASCADRAIRLGAILARPSNPSRRQCATFWRSWRSHSRP